MFTNKKHLAKIKRVRILENRNLEKGLRLNRNEKVSDWSKNILNNIFKNKPSYFLSTYPDNSTIYKKLSKYLHVPEKNILLTSGIDEAIKMIFEVYTEEGDKVIFPSPTYAMYSVYSNIYNTNKIELTYEKLTLNINYSHLINLINQKPKIIFLPNPNQPLEGYLNKKKIINLAKITSKKGILLVIDEAYFMFGSQSSKSLINKYKNLIILRTFSKGFGVPSIRLGFIIASNSIMLSLSKIRLAHETSSLKNAVAEYLIDNIHLVRNYNNQIKKSREQVKKKLTFYGFSSYGNYGNFLFIDLKNKDIYNFINLKFENNLIYVKKNYSKSWKYFISITIGPYRKMKVFLDVFKQYKKLKSK